MTRDEMSETILKIHLNALRPTKAESYYARAQYEESCERLRKNPLPLVPPAAYKIEWEEAWALSYGLPLESRKRFAANMVAWSCK